MYNRAPRSFTQPSGSTEVGVGPGTYHRSSLKPRRDSYAPFCSMAARESFLTVSEQLAAAPGPGHYSPTCTQEAIKGGGSLNSRANRFVAPPERAPGPGAYGISKRSDWLRKTYPPPGSQDRKTPKSGVRYHRKPTAPSIPMPGHNYGYEEEEDGSLKPQQLPSRDKSMGPAYYDVFYEDTATSLKYKGVHFSNLRSLRTQFKGRDGPGPGDYDPYQRVEEGGGAERVMVAGGRAERLYQHGRRELSNLPRYHELVTRIEEKKAVPGPGHYKIRSQFSSEGRNVTEEEEEEEESEIVAPFGSRQKRFLVVKHASPACTTYQDPRSAFERAEKLTRMKETPFGQTSARFKTDRQAKALPGPGTYNNSEVTSLAAELCKKAVQQGIQKCPFGTTSVRTAPLVKRDEVHMPGPAHYQRPLGEEEEDGEVKAAPPPKVSHPSYTFASTSSRLHSPPKIVTDIPPPGSYEVSDAYTKSQGKMELQRSPSARGSFLSSAQRFVPPRDILLEEPDSFNPGPGEYEPEHFSPLCKGKPGLLCAREDRFKPVKSSVPGPGAYQLSKPLQDTVLRGTFNVTLTNPLAPEQTGADAAPKVKKHTFVLGV